MQTDWPRVTNRNSRKDVRRKLETVIILRKKQTEACKIEILLLLCVNISSVTQYLAGDLPRESNLPSVSSAS